MKSFAHIVRCRRRHFTKVEQIRLVAVIFVAVFVNSPIDFLAIFAKCILDVSKPVDSQSQRRSPRYVPGSSVFFLILSVSLSSQDFFD